MKTKSILAALLLMMAGLQTVLAQKVVLHKTNGQTIECEVSELDSIVFVEKQDIIDGNHEWVDLGLPSGTLWATCNVGASCPEEYGDYFSWGETVPKTTYDWGHYKYNRGSGKMTKYCTVESFGINGFTDGLTELLPEDDAATANWGSEWQMPSLAQIEELVDASYTTKEWTVLNGFIGKKITSKRNGNWIFLPAAGYYESMILNREGNFGGYWSRSLSEGSPINAYDFAIMWNDIFWGTDRRFNGESVRPVSVQRAPRTYVTEIVLSETSLELYVNESKSLTATVLPEDADFPAVRWESSDEMVAMVSDEGIVTAVEEGTCIITCSATDGTGIKAECQVKVIDVLPTFLTCPDENHPHAIDLGLPSGTKWCCCNVGANRPEEYGGYFAWGETSEKSVYDWDTYVYGSSWENCVNIGSDISATDYDAATVNMGAPWRMPSDVQQQELLNNSSNQWIQQNGVYGRLVTGPNGGQVFLPAAGFRMGDELHVVGGGGHYWSSLLFSNDNAYANGMFFGSGNWGTSCDYRSDGLSVRAVCP